MKYTKEIYIAVAVGIITIIAFFMLGFFGWFNLNTLGTPQQPVTESSSTADAILNELATTGTVSTLRVVKVAEGEGEAAAPGDTITVHYIGALPDGTTFDSSIPRGTPFSFTVGAGQVIRGWDEGLLGARVGDRILLAIPPEFGYGERSAGVIPPNSTLLFDVEVLGVEKPTVPQE